MRPTTPLAQVMLTLAAEVPQRLFLYIGGVDIHRLDAYLLGYERALSDLGQPDAALGDFCRWLRDVKKEHPGEGWPTYFLNSAGGNQVAALTAFLQRVNEYFGVTDGNSIPL